MKSRSADRTVAERLKAAWLARCSRTNNAPERGGSTPERGGSTPERGAARRNAGQHAGDQELTAPENLGLAVRRSGRVRYCAAPLRLPAP